MEPFASNLRRRAEELGISNAEAARRVGLSERRYGNYISGRREPDLATLVRIAAILETTPNHLLSFGEDGTRASASVPRQRIASAANVLSKADSETVAIMIEALAATRRKRTK
ncbi:MAG: helix-turn-helix transcriptional regulator [Xanthobacteraceae bacterium]|nr:helix-turn-helix transcriptional regulator [Xanthobacteraceae bacterium]